MRKRALTVADIHKDFKTLADAFVAEAKKAEVAVKDPPKKPEILERYEKLGLKRNKHIKEYAQMEADFNDKQVVYEENQRMVKIIEAYRVLYPAHPFIPENNLQELCKKYGLVFDKAAYFTEDIPLDCLEAMEKFEPKGSIDDPTEVAPYIPPDPYASQRRRRKREGFTVKEIKPTTGGTLAIDMNWHESFNRAVRQSIVDVNTGFIESGNTIDALRNTIAQLTTPQKTKEFHIVGTKDMFDLPWGRSWDEKSHTSEDDPIVLYQVRFGWLIIAAWGPEAELPEINLYNQ
jgi:hypothetical protein